MSGITNQKTVQASLSAVLDDNSTCGDHNEDADLHALPGFAEFRSDKEQVFSVDDYGMITLLGNNAYPVTITATAVTVRESVHSQPEP